MTEFVLRGRVFGEKMERPGYCGGGGVMPRAEESHDLISHGFKRHAPFHFAARGRIVAHDHCDDVFFRRERMGHFLGLLVTDDVGSNADEGATSCEDFAPGLHGQVFGQGCLGLKSVE